MLGWLLALLGLLVGLFWLMSANGGTASDLEPGKLLYVAAAGALVLVYMLSLAEDYRGHWLKAIRHLAIWVGLGLVVVAGFAFRNDLGVIVNRVGSEVLPAGRPFSVESANPGEQAVRLRKSPNGHFVAHGEIDGYSLSLLVDTGASTVVLSTADAEKVGIDMSNLSYSLPVQTANGTTYAAPVRLKSLAIGPIVVEGVEALIAQPGNLKESLLGMSFLKRLRSYEFSGEFLTLRG